MRLPLLVSWNVTSRRHPKAMKWQHHSIRRSSKGWRTALIICMVVAGLFAAAAATAAWYYHRSLQPLQTSGSSKEITIPTGATVVQIADQLKEEQLIHNSWAFEYYVRLKHGEQYLMAGTYVFSPSQSVPSIVSQLTHGKVATKLIVILPGQRIDQIRRSLIDQGFSETEVDTALRPAQYENLAVLADKPKGVSLEGYLYPDSFERSPSTTATDIIKQSLTQMDRHLTTAIKQGFADQGLTTYQGLIMASIVEKEVVTPTDRAQAAQVFIKRLKENMRLGSDVTAFYGAYVAGVTPSVNYDSAYNTRLHGGLPPTPISNISLVSLQAVANPAKTDWLYFVAGDDGTTHFSKTYEEHQKLTQQYCKKLCH